MIAEKAASLSYLAKVLDDLFLFRRSEQRGRARAPLYLVEVLLLEFVEPLTLYMRIPHKTITAVEQRKNRLELISYNKSFLEQHVPE